jgi:hypothetical protein
LAAGDAKGLHRLLDDVVRAAQQQCEFKDVDAAVLTLN